jgi:thioredoxin reductase
MTDYDVIIVGGGPAGLNAALILGRCRRRVLVCDAGKPRNRVSQGMHGYLTRDGVLPGELLRIGREEIARYGVAWRSVTVIAAGCHEDGVSITLEGGEELTARKLLLATGVSDCLPDIDNIEAFYGRSVWHCPYCDGWEARDQPLAVYGTARPAVGMALSLLTWTNDLVICLDGTPPPGRRDRQKMRAHRIGLRIEKIVRLEGENGCLRRIHFAQGEPLERTGMFFNTDQNQRCALAEKLGCNFDPRGHVTTDSRGRTGVSNLFLAGDANGDVQFVIVAAAEGAQAAVAINRELQEENRTQSPDSPRIVGATAAGEARKVTAP